MKDVTNAPDRSFGTYQAYRGNLQVYFRLPWLLPLIAGAFLSHPYAESAHAGNGQLGFRYNDFHSKLRKDLFWSAAPGPTRLSSA